MPGQFARRSFKASVSGAKCENTLACAHGEQLFMRRPRYASCPLFHWDARQHLCRCKIREHQKSAVLTNKPKKECGPRRTCSRSKACRLIDCVFHFFCPARMQAVAIQRTYAIQRARDRICFLVRPLDGVYGFFMTAAGERRSPSALQFPEADRPIQ